MTTIAQSSSEAQKVVPFHDGARFVHEVARRQGVVLPPSVCQLIAEHLRFLENIQDIVADILWATQGRKQPLILEFFVEECLQQWWHRKQNYLASEVILQTVADYFCITVKELRSRARHKHLYPARRMASHLLHEMCGLSSSKSAALLNRGHHTTVLAQLKSFVKQCESDPTTMEDLQEVRRMVLQRAGLS